MINNNNNNNNREIYTLNSKHNYDSFKEVYENLLTLNKIPKGKLKNYVIKKN